MPGKRKESKADPREETMKRGRTLLSAWGVHEGALPSSGGEDQILAMLVPLIGRDPSCDLVIAEWLGRLAVPESAARLLKWEATAGRELKKEIRRSIFRLEQKGVRVERAEAPRPVFSLADAPAEPSGYLGGIDGGGARLAWLVRRDPSGVNGLFTIVSDVEGMVSVDAGTMPRARFADALKEFGEAAGAPAAVPWRYADAVMHAAFRKAPPRPGNVRADYLLARGDITAEPPAEIPPCPIREILSGESTPDETGETALLERSADLFRDSAFGSWVIPEGIARVHIQKLVNANASGIVLSREASAERITAIMDGALDDLLAGDHRPILARRLEEMAWLFHMKNRPAEASLALAVAVALENPEGRRMKEISFLRVLVFRAFAPLMAPPGAGAHRHGPGCEHGPHEEPGSPGEDRASELAEGSSRIIDPSKAAEAGVAGAGRLDAVDTEPRIIIP